METQRGHQLLALIRDTLLKIRVLAGTQNSQHQHELSHAVAHLQALSRVLRGTESLDTYLPENKEDYRQQIDASQHQPLADQWPVLTPLTNRDGEETRGSSNDNSTDLLIDLLVLGSQHIAALLTTQDTDHIFLEADHLHNLPLLIADYDSALLDYYLDVERRCYLRQASCITRQQYQPIWHKLQRIRHRNNSVIVRIWTKVRSALRHDRDRTTEDEQRA